MKEPSTSIRVVQQSALLNGAAGLFMEAARGAEGPGFAAARAVLGAAGFAFGAAACARAALYREGVLRSHQAPCPVISVGNLTAGGTGKTPAARLVMRMLAGMGRRPALLSRGFGAASTGGMPDEEAEHGGSLESYASPDRVASSEAALRAGADCLVLDDGFQHLRMRRDLDVLLVDALDPFGGGRMLPAGLLREPVRAARRAGLVLITRADLAGEPAAAAVVRALKSAGCRAPVALARHAPVALEGAPGAGIEWLRGARVAALSGIGNPAAFAATLARAGADVALEFRFPDHHAYSAGEVSRVASESAEAGAQSVVTTGKDWGKVAPLWPGAPPLSLLRIEFEVLIGARHLEAGLARALAAGDARARPRAR